MVQKTKPPFFSKENIQLPRNQVDTGVKGSMNCTIKASDNLVGVRVEALRWRGERIECILYTSDLLLPLGRRVHFPLLEALRDITVLLLLRYLFLRVILVKGECISKEHKICICEKKRLLPRDMDEVMRNGASLMTRRPNEEAAR